MKCQAPAQVVRRYFGARQPFCPQTTPNKVGPISEQPSWPRCLGTVSHEAKALVPPCVLPQGRCSESTGSTFLQTLPPTRVGPQSPSSQRLGSPSTWPTWQLWGPGGDCGGGRGGLTLPCLAPNRSRVLWLHGFFSFLYFITNLIFMTHQCLAFVPKKSSKVSK